MKHCDVTPELVPLDRNGGAGIEPAVVVVAYNRPLSLRRLLGSIKQAQYPESGAIPLVISIDFSESAEVRQIAEEFEWGFGPKRVVLQKSHLGLRAHILQCGDLCEQFGAVVILEDDLTVSPGYYDFLLQALPVYSEDTLTCGISLYQTTINPEYKLRGFEMPFSPVQDGFDNYFAQHVSSWGQCWTREQWREFRAWLADFPADRIAEGRLLPKSVRSWPESSSWAKFFQQYMLERGKYFVFPRGSLSTNWGERGTNFDSDTIRYQSPLILGPRPWRLSRHGESLSVYDVHHEMEASCLKRINPELEPFDFESDLYAVKEVDRIRKPYVLTSRATQKGAISYGAAMFPLELNLAFRCLGGEIQLVKLEDLMAAAPNQNPAPIRVQSSLANLNKFLAFEEAAKDRKAQLKTVMAELQALRHERGNWLIQFCLGLRSQLKRMGKLFLNGGDPPSGSQQ